MDTVIKGNTRVEKAETQSEEKIKRSLVKTISWRIVGTIATIIISWLITGTLALAFSIGFIELISKLVLYYYHERAWNKIKWGK
jgi:uncharacterized membrane protein